MFRPFAALLLAVVLAAPAVVALPPSSPVVVPGTIGSGETATYANGEFVVVGNVTVEDGGTLIFDHANVTFVGGPWVITIEPGGRFDSSASTLRADPTGAPRELFPARLPGPGIVDARYQQVLNTALGHPLAQTATNRSFRVEVQPGAEFDLVGTRVENATGVDVVSPLTTIQDVEFLQNEVGLTLHDVDIEISGLNFTQNLIGIRVFGGTVRIEDGYFDRNDEHIVAEDADLTLEDNEVYAGLRGLVARGGSTTLNFNTFQEHMGPDTLGVWLRNMEQATLHANTIENWERNVVIENTPTTFTDNVVRAPTDSSATLLDVRSGSEEAAEDHTVAYNTFRWGSVSVRSDETPGDVLVHHNALENAWMSVSGSASDVHHNTMTDAAISVSGAGSHVHDNTGLRAGIGVSGVSVVEDNTIDGDGSSGWMSVSDGALLRDNVVQNSDSRCFVVSRATSIGNLASQCRHGFALYADDDGAASSTGDRYERAAYDPDAGRIAFELVGHDATLTDAYAERANTGIRVLPLEINDGGSTILRATVVDGGTGIDVHVDTWDVFIEDSDILRNEMGILAQARDTHVDDTRIRDSTSVGIYATGGTVLGEQNWIEGNVLFGVELGDAGHATLENCYWGHPGGATDATHPGQGDKVSDDVDWQPHRSTPPS